MSTRRTHLASLGALGAGALGVAGFTLAAPARPAHAACDPWQLVARRTELTLPAVPTLGVPYLCLLDLSDPAGAPAGTATADATVVGVTLDGPIVLATVVLQLLDGEIHYQRILDRFGDYPRTAVGAILGGTGAYRDMRGEVDISWPDPDQVDLTVRPA